MAFEEKSATVDKEVNAKQEIYNGEEAWTVIAEASKVYVASGKKIIEFDPATADKKEMLKKITGRTGNLRAPALKRGEVFYIGYNAEMYDTLI
jgi:hypothetical protein